MNALEQMHELTYKITPRETEIIRLLADGNDTRAIAAALGITMDTVESHRHNIMKKTGCRNTAHVVYVYTKNGVIG